MKPWAASLSSISGSRACRLLRALQPHLETYQSGPTLTDGYLKRINLPKVYIKRVNAVNPEGTLNIVNHFVSRGGVGRDGSGANSQALPAQSASCPAWLGQENYDTNRLQREVSGVYSTLAGSLSPKTPVQNDVFT
jgi:hypothetical protein